MKKLLLLAALALGAATSQAAEGFTATCNGVTLTDGMTVYAHWEAGGPIEQFASKISFNSTTDEPVMINMIWDNLDGTAIPSNFGLQACYGNCYSPSSLPFEMNFEAPAAGNSFMNFWTIDVSGLTEEQQKEVYHTSLTFKNLESETDDVLTIKLVFAGTESGVDEIATEAATPIYFQLDGKRVENPENGIYIVRRGGKVTKEVIRK